MDGSDAAWSSEPTRERWSQRSSSNGQHGERTRTSVGDKNEDELKSWMRSERPLQDNVISAVFLIFLISNITDYLINNVCPLSPLRSIPSRVHTVLPSVQSASVVTGLQSLQACSLNDGRHVCVDANVYLYSSITSCIII